MRRRSHRYSVLAAATPALRPLCSASTCTTGQVACGGPGFPWRHARQCPLIASSHSLRATARPREASHSMLGDVAETTPLPFQLTRLSLRAARARKHHLAAFDIGGAHSVRFADDDPEICQRQYTKRQKCIRSRTTRRGRETGNATEELRRPFATPFGVRSARALSLFVRCVVRSRRVETSDVRGRCTNAHRSCGGRPSGAGA